MTSLSKQLKQISKSSSGVRAAASFKPSFLFSQKEASDYDNEYILSIGVEGLVDLCKLDPRFEDFKSSLFHASSLSVDRASMVS
jgi:U3 small nucleolar RNA-associated protein 10